MDNDRNPAPGEGPPPIDLTDPASCLTNLPGLLGFHPRGRLIAVVHGGGRDAGPILTRPAPPPERVPMHLAAGLAEVRGGDGARPWVDVFLVDRSWPAAAARRAEVAAAARLAGHRLRTWAGAARVAAGVPLRDDRGAVLGVLGDPAASAAARHLAAAGEAIAAGPGALAERFAPDPAAAAAGAAALAEVRAEWAGLLAAERPEQTLRRRRAWLADWEGLVAEVAAGRLGIGEVLGEVDRLRVLARALVDLTVRDTTMCAIGDEREPVARALWLAAAGAFEGEPRAHALAIYGLDRYARGCPAVADAALAAAEEAHPGHSLSALLRRAIDAGRGSMAVRSMTSTSRELAEALRGPG